MWMIPAGIYLAYSMIRGLFVDWYPYHFLDPARQGYWAIAGLLLIVTVIMAACGLCWHPGPVVLRRRMSKGTQTIHLSTVGV